MNFTIQKLTLSEEPELLNFINSQSKNDLNLFTRWNKLNKSTKTMAHSECIIPSINGERIIAKTSSGKIVGFGLVDYFEEAKKNHVSVVGTIVDKEFRKFGLGKKLLKNEIEISRKSKKNKIRATIHEHNVDSVKLHQSLGFKIEGKFVNEEFYDEYWTVLSLALFLD